MGAPNFFIVGAPKCGTTSLSIYLREHVNVFMCTPKEPHYFATDLPKYRVVTSEEEYLKLFSGVTSSHMAVGEASATYLYSNAAIPGIKQFNPHSKIIVMIRNPVDLVYSMHSSLVYSRDEDEEVFERAWELNSSRKAGKMIPKRCHDRKMLYYDEIAKLGFQIKRLLQYFPTSQIMTIFTEDFFQDTKKVYENVLDFLGLPNDQRDEFPVFNRNKSHKYLWLANFTQRPPDQLLKIAFRFKDMLNLKRLGILRTLRNANVELEPRKSLDRAVRQMLINEYKTDINMLSKLTRRDLSHWLKIQ